MTIHTNSIFSSKIILSAGVEGHNFKREDTKDTSVMLEASLQLLASAISTTA